MVKQQHITDSQLLRLKAVHCKQHNQSWTAAKIGRHIGCHRKFVSRWLARHQQSGSINDLPRSGRPHKADSAAQNYICMAAQLPECTSAADIAAKTQQASVSPEIEPQHSHTFAEEERAAAPDSQGSSNAHSQAEAGQG